MASLLLNMIVRNEADKIERCLKTVAPYLSGYVIVDTGSTDGTQALIESFFDRLNIPGQVLEAPFENFMQARNVALEAARAYTGSPYGYILLVDADMELVVEQPTCFNRLKEKSYNMLQQAGPLRYWNKRLVHRLTPGDYCGVTHEFLNVGDSANLAGAYFIDHADGSNRPDKFKRDIRLLKADLRKDPNNDRSVFYLANSYRDDHQFAEAARRYHQRILMGGWDEEVWNSRYNLAKCYKDMDYTEKYVHGLLETYNSRPSRAEPLYDLANFYRNAEKNDLAVLFAMAALQVPPTNDLLFVNSTAYKHGPLEELSISGFYHKNPAVQATAFAACNTLMLDRTVPDWMREQAKNNAFFYLKPLKEYAPSFEAKRINFTPPDGYVAMNPSIAKVFRDDSCEHLYYVLIRTVNYTMDEHGRYLIRAGDGSITNDNPIHTRTFLVGPCDNMAAGVPKEVMLPGDWPAPRYTLVRSWEDLRLIARGRDLWANAAVREHVEDGLPEQFEARIAEVDGCGSLALENWRLLQHPPRTCEKNWCPIEGTPGYQYRLGHIVDGQGNTIHKSNPELFTDTLSGGSQLIPFNGGWLTVVHEARPTPGNGKRYYMHRFAWMDHEFNLIKLSIPFVFHAREIEFAMGLVAKDDKFVISYGRRDCEAWLATVDREDVRKMLWG